MKHKKQKKEEIIPEWSLSDLYVSMFDPKIRKDKEKIKEETQSFIKTYKGKINNPSLQPKTLLRAIRLYESIWEKIYIYGSYASYIYAKNTQDEKIGKFYQESEEFANTIRSELLWLELEIIEIPPKLFAAIQKNTSLSSYIHYLHTLRAFKSHTLSENEETVMTKKSQTSSTAFIRLYDQISTATTFRMKIKGKIKELTYQEITPFLTANPDRNIRKHAALAVTEGFKKQQKLYTFILNTLLLDKKISDEIRRYSYPQEQTLLTYEINSETVSRMTSAIQKRYTIAEKFYKAKQKILGVPELYEWDRYSSLKQTPEKHFTWGEAKEVILENFSSFSPIFSNIAKKFFDGGWIDAKITQGKRDGAFCSYNSPSKHPFILLNYNGTMRDVETLAHELGHGIHGYLASKHNTLLEAWPSTVTAEIASVFCESVIFEALFRQQTDKTIQQNMLVSRIQSNFATIFRQNAFYLFESDIHEFRRMKGELSGEDINEMFQKRMQAMFGKGLTLTNGHAYWWMPVLHFYHYNFYVFSYAFGEMMSTALYARYREEKNTFVNDYINALSFGGSKNPYEITKTMGVNVDDPKFWDRGLDIIEGYVDLFITLS